MLYSLGISALCFQQPVRHLHQYIRANANNLRYMASYISTVDNLGEFPRASESDCMGFLYPYNSKVGGNRRLLEPHLHSIYDS